MKNVLVNLPVEERHKKKLEAAGTDCRFSYALPGEATGEQIRSAEIIIGNLPTEKLKAAKSLKFLQLSSAGAAEYAMPGVLPEGTLLASATGAYGRSVAEHAYAVTWMLMKNLHLYRDEQRLGEWRDCGPVRSLCGATAAVVGLGDIGLYYARMAKSAGAYVIGVKRRLTPCPDGVDELYTAEMLPEVLSRADVVFSVLPGTKDTEHFFRREHFQMMKKTAIFINCGRGSAVSDDVLYEALVEKEIAAASVDVTEQEPLPADSPLWKLDNLLITPHISGGFHLPETFEMIIEIAAANLSAYLNGEKLISEVDYATGYCK